MGGATEDTVGGGPIMRIAAIGFMFFVSVAFGLSVGVWEKAFGSGDFAGAARRLDGVEKALALILAGRTDKAMRLLEGRSDVVSLRLFGYAACCEGRWSRALDAAKELLERNGDDMEAQAIYAEALLGLGDKVRAQAVLEKLPAQMSAYVRLRVALMFGEAEEARSAACELEKLTGCAEWRRIATFPDKK